MSKKPDGARTKLWHGDSNPARDHRVSRDGGEIQDGETHDAGGSDLRQYFVAVRHMQYPTPILDAGTERQANLKLCRERRVRSE